MVADVREMMKVAPRTGLDDEAVDKPRRIAHCARLTELSAVAPTGLSSFLTQP
jgi:hypothetical protein